MLYPALITEALATVRYPGSGKNLVELGMVEDDIRIAGDNVSFTLILTKLPTPSKPLCLSRPKPPYTVPLPRP